MSERRQGIPTTPEEIERAANSPERTFIRSRAKGSHPMGDSLRDRVMFEFAHAAVLTTMTLGVVAVTAACFYGVSQEVSITINAVQQGNSVGALEHSLRVAPLAFMAGATGVFTCMVYAAYRGNKSKRG